ncbi:hypothetical protein DVH24_034242 [Malus domestica]|uniref:pectinesterase n=1 Tax=Malus domestica TaxID=3750 RepID=A0A498KVR5_MALDO|nr:hypothetical protein DVH24_034242 [Malus domestica]
MPFLIHPLMKPLQNSYNNPVNSNPITTAVAALIAGDKSTFYRFSFFGFQDTLWDVKGRHYYKLSTIQGAIHFIFGSGQSIFEVEKVDGPRAHSNNTDTIPTLPLAQSSGVGFYHKRPQC